MALTVSEPVRPSMPSVLKAVLVEAALDFLDLRERRHPLAAGELLDEGRVAADQVAEMAQRQRVAGRRVVGMDGVEILPDQKGRPAGDRHP